MSSLPDGRVVPPPHADERAMLEAWLDLHRETLVLKCSGLDDERLRLASAEPSTLTLLGLLQHMAFVERNWFQSVFAGEEAPELYGGRAAEGGLAFGQDQGFDEVLAVWRAEVARSRELSAAAASLDETGAIDGKSAAYVGDSTVSLRWILVHVIGEYARHNGHADLLRERIDGATGF
ncbi:DinB family protein [Streptomyces sp. NPDC014894]|uniref:DinB family protein n=1 Tax=unclassified Streptomyces TaxID=2593676 RepID=UPI0036FB7809